MAAGIDRVARLSVNSGGDRSNLVAAYADLGAIPRTSSSIDDPRIFYEKVVRQRLRPQRSERDDVAMAMAMPTGNHTPMRMLLIACLRKNTSTPAFL